MKFYGKEMGVTTCSVLSNEVCYKGTAVPLGQLSVVGIKDVIVKSTKIKIITDISSISLLN